MSELFKIVLVTLLTVSGAIVIGQIITSFFIQPVHEWLVLKGEIIDSLIYHANIYCNPGPMNKEVRDETYKELRRRACQLMGKTYAIRCYRLWELLKVIQCHQNIKEARRNLIFLSNSLDDAKYMEGNRKTLREIEELLSIKTGV